MFRYFVMSWDVAAPVQAAVAQGLDQRIRCFEPWRLAHASPGIRVFVTGGRAGVNDIYPLPRQQGVVLGRVFRRRADSDVQSSLDFAASAGEWVLQTEGRALVDDYWGRYVAVFRSPQRGTCVLRDPSGALPCFHKDVEGVAVIFSWLEDLIAFTPHLPTPTVNWNAVAAFLVLRSLGGQDTALEGISQVLPGQLAGLHEGAAPPLSLWKASDFARDQSEPDLHVAAHQLRQQVIDCVHAWSATYDSVLLRLSGGVDSAILLASLCAKPTQTKITGLNYHSPGSDSDERVYARLAAARASVLLIERERDSNFSLDDVLKVSRTPVPEAYVGRMGANRTDAFVANACGAQAMFTGGGGDQLFFELQCCWPAADYLKHHGVGRGFLRACLDAARLGKVSLWHSMWRALADQRHRTSPVGELDGFVTLAGRAALDVVSNLEQHIHPDLRNQSALPIGKWHQLRMLVDASGYYDPYLCEASPELVNPLLSQPIIEMCLRLPTWLLTRGGQGRALARLAFAHDLPPEIVKRQSKGGMEAYVQNMLRRNLATARELLLEGHLVRHGLLDADKLTAALDGRMSASTHSAAEIHHCVAIEAWLRRFLDSPARQS